MRLFLTKKNYWSIVDILKKYFKYKEGWTFILDINSMPRLVDVSPFLGKPVLCITNPIGPIILNWICYRIDPGSIYFTSIPIGSKLEFKGTTIKITIYDGNEVYHYTFQRHKLLT